MVIMNSEELSKCGIFSTGSNQIANKIESVEIERSEEHTSELQSP